MCMQISNNEYISLQLSLLFFFKVAFYNHPALQFLWPSQLFFGMCTDLQSLKFFSFNDFLI